MPVFPWRTALISRSRESEVRNACWSGPECLTRGSARVYGSYFILSHAGCHGRLAKYWCFGTNKTTNVDDR